MFKSSSENSEKISSSVKSPRMLTNYDDDSTAAIVAIALGITPPVACVAV